MINIDALQENEVLRTALKDGEKNQEATTRLAAMESKCYETTYYYISSYYKFMQAIFC